MLKTLVYVLFISVAFFRIAYAEVGTSTTSVKMYKLPREGVRIKPGEANYSIFPNKLSFSPEKKIFLVSRKWQMACLYNELGEKILAFSTPLCIQTATGKKDFPTELGLYNIQTKYGKDYKSTFYNSIGEKPEKIEDGAPMPYTMHIGRIIGLSSENKFWFDFSDGTAIHEKQTINKSGSVSFVSHGCIAVEKGMGKKLQSILGYGDLVLVFNETIPDSIVKMISIDN